MPSGAALATSARIDEDGRIAFSIRSKSTKLPALPDDYGVDLPEFGVEEPPLVDIPVISIVIFIVGSRGDVQPFLPLGRRLQKDGHRVRIATHTVFKDFVLGSGLEFFDIGGDPAELMSYMVKNPGLIPGFESLVNGDIPKKRKMIGEIMNGCWRACYEPDPVSGEPFAADAIIANPPSFAHVHCAEALNIPLQIVFTMPWVSTQAFPHPLVNISQSDASPGLTNYLSYVLVDLLAWQGLSSIINGVRESSLGLKPLSLRSGVLILERLRIPTTFCWSPALIPKPKDWKSHIDVSGFLFHPSGSDYTPDAELVRFLDQGEPPVYIGFGSVPVPDPATFVSILLDAVKASGVRALLSIGWANLGADLKEQVPQNIFLLGNVPHDWLFPNCKAVVHHGGAGTTAIGVRLGRPTLVGDQPFWGEMISQAGAGPPPIPHKLLSTSKLTDALRYLVKSETLLAAAALGDTIRDEDGTEAAVAAFYKHLPLMNMRCDLDPKRVAVFWSDTEFLKLSAFAAQTLIDAKAITLKSLKPHHHVGIGQIFVNPVIGIPKTITAIPLGIANIVGSTAEGFRNMPSLYGGVVRQPGEISDFSSGVKEAGKGFVYGYADAISGVFVEPYKGGQAEGPIGFLKGGAVGIANAMLKPAAGGLGPFKHVSHVSRCLI
ncbi:hypothetical protein RQP46_005583 [Phenoliferia psychrophenolica]